MIAVALGNAPGGVAVRRAGMLAASPLVSRIFVVGDGPAPPPAIQCQWIRGGGLTAGKTMTDLLRRVREDFLLLLEPAEDIELGPRVLERLADTAAATGAGMIYGDHDEETPGGEARECRAIDCQLGSIRDDFSFGPLRFYSLAAVRRALADCGPLPPGDHAAGYDLRLKVSRIAPILHLPERLCRLRPALVPALVPASGDVGGEAHFAYVDPHNLAYQREMEAVATAHLRRLGAWLPPTFRTPPAVNAGSYPVEASVVIPVRNREKTIAAAVRSALAQETGFSFNILVVDNHSTDATGAIVAGLAGRDPRVEILTPSRRDLGIGGCWNEAIYSPRCGRYAVQLDSDDLYSGPDSLERLVAKLRSESAAAVIGAYALVDEELRDIPPGLIDHREWTEENGRNNALRVNGFGAPRAFRTDILRGFGGFPNVSYGEDYAVCLRISRHYRIGRIYEGLYLCRRWRDNTDAALSSAERNRNDAYKDRLRSLEIRARQRLVADGAGILTEGVSEVLS
ncbi:MAG: glycosyltransferase family 2 protein [Pseudomonadota bacterium]|nr:glycosyltransferase family 2 protein [Pseudomonadota bacterium]